MLSSSAWEQKQASLAASDKERSYVIVEACKGHDVQSCVSSLLCLLREPAVGFPSGPLTVFSGWRSSVLSPEAWGLCMSC